MRRTWIILLRGDQSSVLHSLRARVMLLYVALGLSLRHAGAQGAIQHVPVSAACIELNQAALTQAANGRFEEIEFALSAALAGGLNSPEPSCAGVVLCNLATFMAVSGRLADAEMFAERSVTILERSYPPGDPVLLTPLQTLAAVRFEQGKRAKAGEALRRMRSLRIERPEQRAVVHGMAGAMLQAEGRHQEAETEYSAAFDDWEAAGRGGTADAAAILNSLASLYVEEQQFLRARQVLDRALNILTTAKDTVAMDRIRLLGIRAAMHARQGEWREAERDLHDALTIADGESKTAPYALQSLLTNHARALRKNHHRGEAGVIEARLAVLHRDHPAHALVDVTDLLPSSKSVRK